MSQSSNDTFELRPHHCGISVPDIEASVTWYSDVLGFSVAKRMDFGDGKIVFMNRGDFYMELFQMPDSKPSADLQSEMGQDLSIQGTKHIAFVVNDLSKFAENLRKRGVDIPMDFNEREEAPRALFIRDNSGIMLEFVPPTTP